MKAKSVATLISVTLSILIVCLWYFASYSFSPIALFNTYPGYRGSMNGNLFITTIVVVVQLLVYGGVMIYRISTIDDDCQPSCVAKISTIFFVNLNLNVFLTYLVGAYMVYAYSSDGTIFHMIASGIIVVMRLIQFAVTGSQIADGNEMWLDGFMYEYCESLERYSSNVKNLDKQMSIYLSTAKY